MNRGDDMSDVEMSGFPAPTGKPVAYALHGDPWAEQARRHERHKQRQRQRRRKRLMFVAVPTVLVAISAAAGWWFTVREQAPQRASGVVTGAPLSTEQGQSTERGQPADSDLGTAGAVVTEVWLLDRQDGSYDWGLVIKSESEEARAGLVITAVFLDDDGGSVHVETVKLSWLEPGARAVVGGTARLTEPPVDEPAVDEPPAPRETVPVRLEVSATLGEPSVAGAGLVGPLEVRDVERVRSGQLDADDILVGTVDQPVDQPVDQSVDWATELQSESIGVVALWRGTDGAVVAAVFGPALVRRVTSESVRSELAFELALPPGAVPRGMPDEVIVTRSPNPD